MEKDDRLTTHMEQATKAVPNFNFKVAEENVFFKPRAIISNSIKGTKKN